MYSFQNLRNLIFGDGTCTICERMALPSVGIIVIASAIFVLGWMTFINNSADKQFGNFAF